MISKLQENNFLKSQLRTQGWVYYMTLLESARLSLFSSAGQVRKSTSPQLQTSNFTCGLRSLDLRLRNLGFLSPQPNTNQASYLL